MCKKSKEFESESYSISSSFYIGNKSHIPNESSSQDFIKMQISDECEEQNIEKDYKENKINENNNNENNNNKENQIEFNILDDNKNNNNNNNNINQENELTKNFGIIQNLETQNMKKINQKEINLPQPQSLANKSTGEMTNIKIAFEESPPNIEKKKKI